jgi:hypothetical protein
MMLWAAEDIMGLRVVQLGFADVFSKHQQPAITIW